MTGPLKCVEYCLSWCLARPDMEAVQAAGPCTLPVERLQRLQELTAAHVFFSPGCVMQDTESDMQFVLLGQWSRATWHESMEAALEGHASKPQQDMTMFIAVCSKLACEVSAANLSVAEEICLAKYEGLQVVCLPKLDPPLPGQLVTPCCS